MIKTPCSNFRTIKALISGVNQNIYNFLRDIICFLILFRLYFRSSYDTKPRQSTSPTPLVHDTDYTWGLCTLTDSSRSHSHYSRSSRSHTQYSRSSRCHTHYSRTSRSHTNSYTRSSRTSTHSYTRSSRTPTHSYTRSSRSRCRGHAGVNGSPHSPYPSMDTTTTCLTTGIYLHIII